MADQPLRLTAPETALATLLAMLPGPVVPRLVPVAAALGRALAGPLVAPVAVPARPMALAEGWAVAATETLGASAYAPVPLAVAPRRVAAGDPLPAGTDAVLPPFALALDGPFAQVLEPVAPGEAVRLPGDEVAAGTVLRTAGDRLAPRDLPALAACGIAAVAVRVPRVAAVLADDFALDPALDFGLAPLLEALVTAEGAAWQVVPPGAAAGHDLILLVGAALPPGFRAVVEGLGARPGMAVGLGALGATPVLRLPARAEEALAGWWLLGRPALRHLAGASPPPPIHARLTRKVASAVGLLEIVSVRLTPPGSAEPWSAPWAEPLAIGALPAWALAAADALLLVPPGVEGHEAGNAVALEPL